MVRTEGLDKQNKSQAGISATQYEWLKRGRVQPAGKLPLFDQDGAKIPARLILSCLKAGWAEPWFSNPIKADWLVCKLTDLGLRAVQNYEKTQGSICGNRQSVSGDVVRRKRVMHPHIESVD